MKKILFCLICMLIVGAIDAMAALPKDATIYWTAPTTNGDGTPLTDLGGFKVYCGSSPGVYTVAKDVGNVSTYLISNDLPKDGVYYCAVTAYDVNGNESILSNEVSFPLDRTAPAKVTGVGVR